MSPKKSALASANRRSSDNDTEIVSRTKAALKKIRNARSRRCLEFVLANPGTTTPEISAQCAVGNVSKQFAKIRTVLVEHGLAIYCFLPHPRLRNQYGEDTRIHRWRIAKI